MDECFRLKLFLEQFSISSAVLNSELPYNSRQNIIQQFNRGAFDYLIATDASMEFDEDSAGTDLPLEEEPIATVTVVSTETKEHDTSDVHSSSNSAPEPSNELLPEDQTGTEKKRRKKKGAKSGKEEYGVSRGIDFQVQDATVMVT